jgi:hypothetical protein
MTRHITIIAYTATPDGIDTAITEGLQQLREKHKESMELVNAATMHRPHDNAIFVTVIARGTGQVKAVKPKKPEEKQ